MSESLRYTAAISSRIHRNNPLRRPQSSSPFSSLKRKKPPPSSPSSSTKRQKSNEHAASEGRLQDTGAVPVLHPALDLSSLLQTIQHIQSHTFTPMPDRRTGMSSTRIAAVLKFRQSLPPIVSIAHLHALSRSPTSTEREIATLCAQGILRRVHMPQGGAGGLASAAGEGVVLVSQWQEALQQRRAIPPDAKAAYMAAMRAHPTSLAAPASCFTPDAAKALRRAGFLTNAHAAPAPTPTADGFLGAGGGAATRALRPVRIARAPSGSLAAAGGADAFLGCGGGSGGGGSSAASNGKAVALGGASFSLPNTGAYLKLLVASRTHLVALLSKASPRNREMALSSLRQGWNGGVATGTAADEARRERGEESGLVLPGKTRKWKFFLGLECDWVLEECLGAGMVELFDTGSVGAGVRVT